jgi:hypothetical protein
MHICFVSFAFLEMCPACFGVCHTKEAALSEAGPKVTMPRHDPPISYDRCYGMHTETPNTTSGVR